MPDPRQEPPTGPAPDEHGRQRLRDALLGRPSRAQLLVAALLATVGFAAMTQVRSNEAEDAYAGLRQSELVRVFDGLNTTSQRVERQIEELSRTREELQSSTSQREAALEQARQDQVVFGILAGTLPATGPGVRITVNDPNGEVTAAMILDAIQELRAAGAEAMEFNDRVRMIAQTSLEDVAGGIELDGQLVEAPYVIDVIGGPTTLADSIDFPTGPVEDVEEVGGSVDIEPLEAVLIESVVEPRDPDFAEPR